VLDPVASLTDNADVSKGEVDTYLAAVEEPGRSTLMALRQSIAAISPGAEECISYGMPGFKLHGKMIAGFAAFKNHLSYFPHSGSVLAELSAELAGYDTNAGTLRFPVDEPLPKELVKKLIAVRIGQVLNA